MKSALVTGVLGQDGSYLAEILHQSGYDIHGIARTPLSAHGCRIRSHLRQKDIPLTLHECNLLDPAAVDAFLERLQIDECYHMAAEHHASGTASGVDGREVYSANVLSALHLLDAVAKRSPQTRIVLAGSCHMFMGTAVVPQHERVPFSPRSFYGLAKVAISDLAGYYRDVHGVIASVAILYNHESPRRGDEFVTRRIVRGVNGILRGEFDRFELDNLHTVKDWGYARDYASAMARMGARSEPRDFILATGVGRTVGDFVATAARIAGISEWTDHIEVRRPRAPGSMPVALVGDASAAYAELGWRHTVTFEQLVGLMLESEQRGSLD